MSNIYGARVTPTGTVLDPQGFLLSQSANYQIYPAIACNGTNCLVVWDDYRYNGVLGARVSPSGQVLDPQGIVVGSVGNGTPAIAFDGTNYLVVYRGESLLPGPIGVRFDIYGTRVNSAGQVLDPQGFIISTCTFGCNGQFYPRVAFDGTNYLVVWNRGWYPASLVVGTIVSPAASVLSPGDFTISSSATVRYDNPPAVAFTGNNYFVAWTYASNPLMPSSGYAIFGNYITPAGVVTPSKNFQISGGPSGSITTLADPAVGAGGTHVLVVWADARNATGPLFNNTDIYGQMVSP